MKKKIEVGKKNKFQLQYEFISHRTHLKKNVFDRIRDRTIFKVYFVVPVERREKYRFGEAVAKCVATCKENCINLQPDTSH